LPPANSKVQTKILISAGEASGDLYAAQLARVLQKRHPDWELFGCPGARMLAEGVRPVMDQSKLHVVGLVEVVSHLPAIWREYRKLVAAARAERPAVAILTDSPDFHLRVARRLASWRIPVVYLVAPQAWAWRAGRTKSMRRDLRHLLCIFPFEEPWFRQRGVPATYIGHPLAHEIEAGAGAGDFRKRHGLHPDRPLVALLPGSRPGEIRRHLPAVFEAVRLLRDTGAQFALGTPPGADPRIFVNQNEPSSIQVIVGDTRNLLAAADAALAASGTVTMEAALLGTPMVTFYRVNPWSWRAGRWLVRTPFFTMVNLVAERKIVPELMQEEATGARMADEVRALLRDESARRRMRADLGEVSRRLRTAHDPIEVAADIVEKAVFETNHA
jgi:lipid-A-disaccharide synthase